MPELADVEGFRRVFNDHVRGAVRSEKVRDAQVVRGTSPRTRASALSARDCGRLHARMRTVLRQAIDAGRVPPRRNWLTGHRDADPGTAVVMRHGAPPQPGVPISEHGRLT